MKEQLRIPDLPPRKLFHTDFERNSFSYSRDIKKYSVEKSRQTNSLHFSKSQKNYRRIFNKNLSGSSHTVHL